MTEDLYSEHVQVARNNSNNNNNSSDNF